MKSKILAALKTKYKTLGFSDKALDGVADMLAKTVTEETAIDAAIEGVEPFLKALQGDADKRVTEAVEKAKKEAGKKPDTGKKPDEGEGSGGGKKPDGTDPKPDDDKEVPAWAKSLIDSNKALTEKLSTLEADKATASRKKTLEDLLGKDEHKAIPEQTKARILKDFGRMSFAKEEDFTAYLEETTQDIAAISQELADKGLGQIPAPTIGTKKNKDGVSAEVQAYVTDVTKPEGSKFEGKKLGDK
jgi:hypothetical protein